MIELTGVSKSLTTKDAGTVQGQVAGMIFRGLDTLHEVLVDGARVRARVRDAGEPFHPGDAAAAGWPDVAERGLLQ